MSKFSLWRSRIRTRIATQIPAANAYITAEPKSFFLANAWTSPGLVLEFERGQPDDENRLIGQGEQLLDVLFNVYVAISGNAINVQGDADPDNDLGTIEQNEEMANGTYEMIDALEDALMFYEVDTGPVCVVLSRGWQVYATSPNTVIYVTRWVVRGSTVIQA